MKDTVACLTALCARQRAGTDMAGDQCTVERRKREGPMKKASGLKGGGSVLMPSCQFAAALQQMGRGLTYDQPMPGYVINQRCPGPLSRHVKGQESDSLVTCVKQCSAEGPANPNLDAYHHRLPDDVPPAPTLPHQTMCIPDSCRQTPCDHLSKP